MASKQENVSDWMALAKAYDKAEREQGVEPYVIVSLRNRRTRQAKNAAGFVRCKDCCQTEACKYAQRRLKQGVWRICKDYFPNN